VPSEALLIYLRDATPYGEQFAVRQASFLGWARLAIGNEPQTIIGREFVRTIPDPGPVASLDRKVASLLAQSDRSFVGSSAIGAVRLARLISDASVLYTMFGWNAIELERAAVLARSSARFYFHAGGSDITTARARGWRYQRRLARAVERSDKVLCGSEFILQAGLELGFEPEKLLVHYLGVDIPPAVAERPRRTAPRFLAVSRLHPVKGVENTISAFLLASQQGLEATLTIVGDGHLRSRLEDLAASSRFGRRITFTGALPQRDVFGLMDDCDVFVQHNVKTADGAEEALGGSILEAGARALPQIVSDSGGVSEAVIDGVTGRVVRSGDIEAMAEAMLALGGDHDYRESLGEASRIFIADSHNSAKQNRVLEKILLA
jgi:glycosyltransferase involved in cell wall biosynthesis